MAVLLENLLTIPSLKDLGPECLTVLSQTMIQRTYPPESFIFLEGEESGGLWFVHQGQVKIVKYGENGRIQLLCRLHRGKCFGTCPLFNQNMPNPANAQAIDEVTLFILPRSTLSDAFGDNPDLVRALLQVYSQHMSQLARLGECLGLLSTSERINDYLLNFAAAPYNEIQMTHEELAQAAGTAREVVSRHLNKLEKKGWIHLSKGRITVLNRASLEPIRI